MTLHLKTMAVVVTACLGLALTIGAADAAQTEGSASWYCAELHGNKTANGERFDKGAYTAAHRSLAFGTRVCVENQINGRGVTVRINDRGPFTRKRIIDVSQAAATRLGMVSRGTAPVRLRILKSNAKPGQAC
ncbi:MAG: septal ring lytic transglycosylase RlpA family protein [Pseudomonadota bacterium]